MALARRLEEPSTASKGDALANVCDKPTAIVSEKP
jgi:hypothetical protein